MVSFIFVLFKNHPPWPMCTPHKHCAPDLNVTGMLWTGLNNNNTKMNKKIEKEKKLKSGKETEIRKVRKRRSRSLPESKYPVYYIINSFPLSCIFLKKCSEAVEHILLLTGYKWIWFALEPLRPLINQRTLTIGGSITVRLTSCLTGVDWTKQVKVMLIQHKQSSRTQTK